MTVSPVRPLLLALGLLAGSAPARAQTSVPWARTYAQPLNDQLAGAGLDAQGRTFVAGTTALPQNLTEGFVAAWDAAGAPLWTRTTGGAGQLVAWSAMAIDPSGRVAVAGARASASTANTGDALVAEYDALGNLVWSATWNGPASRDDFARAVAFDPAGRVVVAGGSNQATPGNARDGFVAVFTPQGALAWATLTGLPVTEEILDVAIDGAGNVFSVGYGGVLESYMARFDANGTRAWAVTRPLEFLNAIAVDGAQGVYVTGSRGTVGQGAVDFLVASVAAQDGSARWARTATAAGLVSGGNDVAVGPFGEVVATGSLDQGGTNGYEAFTLALDAQGSELWRSGFDPGPAFFTGFLALCFGPGGDVTLAGAVQDTGTGNSWPLLQRIPRGLAPAASWTFAAPPIAGLHTREARFVAVDAAGGVVAAGRVNDLAPNDVAVWRVEPLAATSCFGDGSGTACPCGNASQPAERAGCRSSLGVGGRLDWSGAPSLAGDTFTLHAAFVPDSPGRFVQGSSAIPGGAVFGDGLRCVGGTVVRLGTKTATGGASSYPQAGDAPISVRGLVPGPGATRTYQLHYRNAASFCTSAAFNLTNAVTTTWQP